MHIDHNSMPTSDIEREPDGMPIRRDRPWKAAASYAALLALGGGLGIWGYRALEPNSALSAGPLLGAATSVQAAPVVRPPSATNPDFIADVVQAVGPAVVRIDATRTVTNTRGADRNPLSQRFFGSDAPPSREVVQGVGSGFILSANGEILTNAHVVDGARTVNVTLKDGRSFEGEVMGRDPVTDVAVIKVNADNLPTVALADSEQLKPGEWAIAIGNPLGLNNTVTAGIVSATGRSSGNVGIPTERVRFIQTDAAINPGNSGGPLLNTQGQVIGMNTAIIQGAQGLGFAIPINQVKAIATQLIANGRAEHPYMGIEMVTLTPETKTAINDDPNAGLTVNASQGVLIARVQPNSPAERAGLRAGDVITQINGQSVKTAEEIQQAVEKTTVGREVQLGVDRNGQATTVAVKTEQLPPPNTQANQD